MTDKPKIKSVIKELHQNPEVLTTMKRNLRAMKSGDRVHWNDVKTELGIADTDKQVGWKPVNPCEGCPHNFPWGCSIITKCENKARHPFIIEALVAYTEWLIDFANHQHHDLSISNYQLESILKELKGEK